MNTIEYTQEGRDDNLTIVVGYWFESSEAYNPQPSAIAFHSRDEAEAWLTTEQASWYRSKDILTAMNPLLPSPA